MTTMPTTFHNITVDARDPYALAQWWSQALDRPLSDDDQPGDPEAVVLAKEGPNLLFQAVPEPKTVKNRVHIDLQPDGRTRDEEVGRLVGLGATLVDDRRRDDGTGWVVLADPEGNEFCVERSAAERAATA